MSREKNSLNKSMCDYAKFRNSGVTNGFSVPSI